VEATERLLSGKAGSRGGVASLGELFDARDFLASLDGVTVSYEAVSTPVFARRGALEQQ